MIMPINPKPTPERTTKPEDNLGLAEPALVFRDGRPIFISHDPAVDFDDIRSESYIALMRASEKFDPTRGTKFSSYACKSMRNTARKYLERRKPAMQRLPCETLITAKCITHDTVYHGDMIEKLLAPLTHEQKSIIHMRFFRRPPMTMVQIGSAIGGYGKDTARSRLNEAIEAMREEARLIGLNVEDALT